MTTLRSVAELADLVTTLAGGHLAEARLVVGIAGAPGSGKSTIAAELVELLAPRAALLPMDGFHLPQARLVELGRRDRMGAPDTFDVGGFVTTLAAVRAGFGNSGRTVLAPGFDREIEEPVPGAIAIAPEFPIVVVEGNYLLLGDGGWEDVAPLLDLTVVVGVDRGIRHSRLIARHERYGKSAAAARDWALGPDESNAVLVDASAATATHVIALG